MPVRRRQHPAQAVTVTRRLRVGLAAAAAGGPAGRRMPVAADAARHSATVITGMMHCAMHFLSELQVRGEPVASCNHGNSHGQP
eukprot:1232880-Rhodomonas_salina.1